MMQRKTGPLAGILTLLDVDNFLRQRKGAIRRELHYIIQRCRAFGMTVGLVTGSPLRDVEHLTAVDIILAESGALQVYNGKTVVCQESSHAIDRLLAFLGLKKSVNGRHDTEYGSIIVDGGRRASFTAFCEGAPPHYPGCNATASRSDIEKWLSAGIKHIAVCLMLSVGNDDDCHWVDVINPRKTKSNSIQQLLKEHQEHHEHPYSHVYYGGDAVSDLQVVMENKSIIPLATNNCIAPMRHEAEHRGIYVDEDGPGGGVERVLYSIIDHHL